MYSLSIIYTNLLDAIYKTSAKTDKATKDPAPYDKRMPPPAPDVVFDDVGAVLVLDPVGDFDPVFVAVDPVALSDAAAFVDVVVIAVKGVPQ
jgi:hypothetical protein